MSEAAYLKSTIQSLESTLALANAGLKKAIKTKASCKYHDDVSSFTREQVKQGMNDLRELDGYDSEDNARLSQLLNRAYCLEPENVGLACKESVKRMSATDRQMLCNMHMLMTAINTLRPDVARDVEAVIAGRGNIFDKNAPQE
jgi:hypothetical protein